MIEASLYQNIYLLIVSLLTIIVNHQYATARGRASVRSSFVVRSSFIVAVAVAVYIGLRPVSGRYFVDMTGYNMTYSALLGEPMQFDWSTTNVIFDNLFMFMASKEIPVTLFFLLMSAMNFICTFFACRKIFPRDTMLAFLVFLAAFSTFSYATNGLKAGVAAAWFLLAIAFHDKIFFSILFALISFGFHHSMQLPLVAFFIVMIIRNPHLYFAAWVGSLLVAILHISFFQNLFAEMTDEQGAGYLSFEMTEKWASVIRFRLDFVLYSAVPIIIGYWITIIKKIRSKEYVFILNLYLLTNAVWMLCMYATFTNRIAYLSWFIYPIVLIYPFIKQEWASNQYRIMRLIVYGHLLFTVFMVFIYY